MNISLLKEQLGEKYTFNVEGNSIFIYSKHYKYEPVMICREDGLYGIERGNNILLSDMGSLENSIIACCICLGKDKDKVNQYCAEIRRKIKSAKDNTELEELLSSEHYANMIQNNTCQEIDKSKEDKIIIRNEDNLSFFEYMKEDLKITLNIVPQQTKKYYEKLLYTIINKDFMITFFEKYDLRLNAEEYLNLFGFCVTGCALKIEKLSKNKRLCIEEK